MIEAYPDKNLWRLVSSNKSDVFKIKDKIKSLGGQWTGSYWLVPESALTELKVFKMVKATRAAFCHELEAVVWVSEFHLNQGSLTRCFCSLCDSYHSQSVKVVTHKD